MDIIRRVHKTHLTYYPITVPLLNKSCIKTGDERFLGTVLWRVSQIYSTYEFFDFDISQFHCCFLIYQNLPTFNSDYLVVSVWDLNASIRKPNYRMPTNFTPITKTRHRLLQPPPCLRIYGSESSVKKNHISPLLPYLIMKIFSPIRPLDVEKTRFQKITQVEILNNKN